MISRTTAYWVGAQIPLASRAADRTLVHKLTKQLARYGLRNSRQTRGRNGRHMPKNRSHSTRLRHHSADLTTRFSGFDLLKTRQWLSPPVTSPRLELL